MTLQIALKMTQIELDLITDLDQHLLLESSIRGGMSYVAHRYAKANNPSLPDFDPQLPIKELCYLDANSLYATSQMYELPVGKFRTIATEKQHISGRETGRVRARMSSQIRKYYPLLKRIVRMGNTATARTIKQCNKELMDCISECARNVLKENVPLKYVSLRNCSDGRRT